MAKSIEEILGERKDTHGDFTEHATITQYIKNAMKLSPRWHNLPTFVKESLDMQAHKIGRIIAGNWQHQDHWDDIQGYAKLVVDRIPKEAPAAPINSVPAAPNKPTIVKVDQGVDHEVGGKPDAMKWRRPND